MELRDIRYFAVVAEHQNLGRAAEVLELSATALSKSLRRLEKSVGAKLVQRCKEYYRRLARRATSTEIA